jgi:hypothetical protein
MTENPGTKLCTENNDWKLSLKCSANAMLQQMLLCWTLCTHLSVFNTVFQKLDVSIIGRIRDMVPT